VEGPAVSVPVLPQTRHHERSASQIDRVTQRLWRGVEGPRRCLSYPCCSELFNHRSPTTGPAAIRNGCSREHLFMHHNHLPSPGLCKVFALRKFSAPGKNLAGPHCGWKAPNSMGKISTAGVLRLRATSALCRDQSVRRCAQDDDSVGVLTKNTLNRLGALAIPSMWRGWLLPRIKCRGSHRHHQTLFR
jgi:hypothetical protein